MLFSPKRYDPPSNQTPTVCHIAQRLIKPLNPIAVLQPAAAFFELANRTAFGAD